MLSNNNTTENKLTLSHLRPSPKITESKKLIEAGIKCCMDISDGLNNDLSNLSESSKVSLEIDVEEIPVSEELKNSFPTNYINIAINGGEDYELLFTFDESKIKLPFKHFVIGKVLEKNAKSIVNKNYTCAEFEAKFDTIVVNGIDLIIIKNNLIYEFKVFLRPLKV